MDHIDQNTATGHRSTPLIADALEPRGDHREARIVVGVDGSDCSIDALRWAARQSALTGAHLEAVTSWDYPPQAVMEFGSFDIDWATNAQQALDIALHQAFGDDDVAVRRVVARGRPAQVLTTAARGADLLVVGSRGHGAVAGMLLGSVSEHVAAHAPCPVVVIRHGGEHEQGSGREALAAVGTANADDQRG